HTLPVLSEVVPLYDEPEWSFLVMPRMRPCNSPPGLDTVGEFVEFLEQVLEGLVFLHSKNIAHRDICRANLVMDASKWIPAGCHFLRPWTLDGLKYLIPETDDDPRRGPHVPCATISPFPDNLVTRKYRELRKHIPEVSETVPYDPFKADIRLVGEMVRREFLLRYKGLDFVIPLVKKLRHRDPVRRPGAAEALALFRRLTSRLDKNQPLTGWLDFRHSKRRAVLFIKGLGLH
ncbi:hypothetical protein B0H16DRAFT_1308632, partial [Mycena metata]